MKYDERKMVLMRDTHTAEGSGPMEKPNGKHPGTHCEDLGKAAEGLCLS